MRDLSTKQIAAAESFVDALAPIDGTRAGAFTMVLGGLFGLAALSLGMIFEEPPSSASEGLQDFFLPFAAIGAILIGSCALLRRRGHKVLSPMLVRVFPVFGWKSWNDFVHNTDDRALDTYLILSSDSAAANRISSGCRIWTRVAPQTPYTDSLSGG